MQTFSRELICLNIIKLLAGRGSICLNIIIMFGAGVDMLKHNYILHVLKAWGNH